ncbi:MAG: four helix bundle protein [Patescibacteria group bacterium]
MQIKSFKDLIVWNKAVYLAKEIYKITKDMPQSEMYGLVSQMRRAAVSTPSNIAEGKKRKTRKDFVQFLRVASGSAAELETQIIIAREIFIRINFSQASAVLEEVQKMLSVIIKKLEDVKTIS